jgi:cytochrome c553
MLSLPNRTTFFILFLFFSLFAYAQDTEIARMLVDINEKQATPVLKQQAVKLGQERALLCNQCHGADGNSKKPDVPNLASQNSAYLLEQIEKFANGSRKNYVMNALSKNFSNEDKVNLALFYANMQVKPVTTNSQLAQKGKPLYLQKCSSCHGEGGAGKEKFARLAGQQIQYVENTLRRFRATANDKHSNGLSKRRSIIMESVSKSLLDNDINALAAYIAQLK